MKVTVGRLPVPPIFSSLEHLTLLIVAHRWTSRSPEAAQSFVAPAPAIRLDYPAAVAPSAKQRHSRKPGLSKTGHPSLCFLVCVVFPRLTLLSRKRGCFPGSTAFPRSSPTDRGFRPRGGFSQSLGKAGF